jgi:hypothetical protein
MPNPTRSLAWSRAADWQPEVNVKDGWSGRATARLSGIGGNGVMLMLDGEVGGLGATYKVWSENVRGVVPF